MTTAIQTTTLRTPAESTASAPAEGRGAGGAAPAAGP